MDAIAFHEFLNEPFYKNAYGGSDSKENMTILSPAVENAEHELGVLKRGQCKLLRKFYNNKTKEAQNALRYGAKLTDGTIISAVELHATLHEMMQVATGNKEGSGVGQSEEPKEEPKDGAGEIWEILLGAIPSLLQKLFAAEDPRSKEEMVHTLNEQLPATLGAEVPHIVAEMLEHALTYNLTNILTDSVTAAVEPRISSSVFEGVSGPIELTIYHQTTNRVPHAVSKTVIPTLAERTNRALPRFLERALACRLVFTLTRSISHAVVPTLSKSLTHNNDQDYYCYLCYFHKRHCRLCHNSPQNSYYNNYYGAYYTDYYSKYYSEYYGESCTKKKMEWPPPPIIIPGCMDRTAVNYNPKANKDDGSCSHDPNDIPGCMDRKAKNYNPEATVSDGSCQYEEDIIPGCMDRTAVNYNPRANKDDGSCSHDPNDIPGCMDRKAKNYNPEATVSDGSCQYEEDIIPGCMDRTAVNYNPRANKDDGSCSHDPNDIPGCMDSQANNFNEKATVDDGSCEIPGCKDRGAKNYDSLATVHDATLCTYHELFGCTNRKASNFNPKATKDDGTCIIYGCKDENAPNYDSEATIDDKSCECAKCEYSEWEDVGKCKATHLTPDGKCHGDQAQTRKLLCDCAKPERLSRTMKRDDCQCETPCKVSEWENHGDCVPVKEYGKPALLFVEISESRCAEPTYEDCRGKQLQLRKVLNGCNSQVIALSRIIPCQTKCPVEPIPECPPKCKEKPGPWEAVGSCFNCIKTNGVECKGQQKYKRKVPTDPSCPEILDTKMEDCVCPEPCEECECTDWINDGNCQILEMSLLEVQSLSNAKDMQMSEAHALMSLLEIQSLSNAKDIQMSETRALLTSGQRREM
eukprot:g9086.t1